MLGGVKATYERIVQENESPDALLDAIIGSDKGNGMADNTLYYGDNLDILRRYIKDESVDLIYLDPPFKSDQNYNILFTEQNGTRSTAQIEAFEDTWRWDQAAAEAFHHVVKNGPTSVSQLMVAFRTFLGESDMLAYLSMMAPRLVELHRVLKPSGSLYLHCDPTASAHLRLLLDAVFGTACFQNEIVWNYGPKATQHKGHFQRKHDTLLFYGKESKPFFNEIYGEYGHGSLAERDTRYKHQDQRGRYRMTTRRRSDGSKYRAKVYLRKGVLLHDVWDIGIINPTAKERLSYPTQKPEKLLERIIEASSNKGDIVLDPFCGCGTAVAIAQRMKRRWIGIDITHLAINLIKHRLYSAFTIRAYKDYDVVGEPCDTTGAKQLSKENPHQFQSWALGLAHARPTKLKKGPDKGIDGRLYFYYEGSKAKQILFSVKSGKVAVSDIRDLRGVIEREKAEIGVYISLNEHTKAMRTEAASAGFYEVANLKFPRLQLFTVEELLRGKRINYPGEHGGATFKNAPKAKNPNKTENLPLD